MCLHGSECVLGAIVDFDNLKALIAVFLLPLDQVGCLCDAAASVQEAKLEPDNFAFKLSKSQAVGVDPATVA